MLCIRNKVDFGAIEKITFPQTGRLSVASNRRATAGMSTELSIGRGIGMPSEPESMTPYQKMCERFLVEMLNSYDLETLSEPAFKTTAKSLIRFYPEFTMENENPYKVFDLYRKCFRFTKRGWDQ